MGDQQNVNKSISNRNDFLTHLNSSVSTNDNFINTATKHLEKLQLTCENIKTLSKYPEHDSIIPLGANIYMNGRIIHTGEYCVKKEAHPESYLVLKTVDQTLESLQGRIDEQKSLIEKGEYAKLQLEERMNVLKGGLDLDLEKGEDMESMPIEIKSDKGVAMKVGDFYEIVEYED